MKSLFLGIAALAVMPAAASAVDIIIRTAPQAGPVYQGDPFDPLVRQEMQRFGLPPGATGLTIKERPLRPIYPLVPPGYRLRCPCE